MGKRSDFPRIECKRVGSQAGAANPAFKHGHNQRGSRSTEYTIWVGIRSRTLNVDNPLYPYYGGRGITLCERWNDFATFLADVGFRPSASHSLDRIDNNEGYRPDNVRWATRKEQSRNRRNNILIEGITLREHCERENFNYKTVWRWYARENKPWTQCLVDGRERWGRECNG